jgi:hypothetical protein
MTDELLPPDHLPYLDSHSDLAHLGAVELDHPTTSLAGDGVLDTETVHEGGELIIASDLHHEGFADHLKVVDPDGEYSSWEYRHDDTGSHWVETDHGHLGG